MATKSWSNLNRSFWGDCADFPNRLSNAPEERIAEFEFEKRGQQFNYPHYETLSAVAMCVGNDA
jgi:hypothetical protein